MSAYKGITDPVENLTVEDDVLVMNINGKVFDSVGQIETVDLPEEGEEVVAGEEIASISGTEGDVQLRAPISGVVLEINDLFTENILKTIDDATLYEWLLKIEPQDPEDLVKFEE